MAHGVKNCDTGRFVGQKNISHHEDEMSYVSTVYGLTPDVFDLEDASFENVDTLCQKIVNDIKTRFRRQLKYIAAECL